jgi:hypothetical protein
MLMVSAIAGVGFGPLAVGVASDQLKGLLGGESLRWALAVCAVVYLAASGFYLQAAKKSKGDMAPGQ